MWFRLIHADEDCITELLVNTPLSVTFPTRLNIGLQLLQERARNNV